MFVVQAENGIRAAHWLLEFSRVLCRTLGGCATQYALNGGANPVCVVSNEEKARIVRSMGADKFINRSEMDFKFWNEDGTQQNPKEWLRLGKAIREITVCADLDIVFEQPGSGKDRKRGVQGKSGSIQVDLVCVRIIIKRKITKDNKKFR